MTLYNVFDTVTSADQLIIRVVSKIFIYKVSRYYSGKRNVKVKDFHQNLE